VEAIGGLVELVVGEAAPDGLVRRRLDVDDALLGEGLVRVAPAAEGQQPLEAPAPEVVHPPSDNTRTMNLPSSQCAAMPRAQLGRDSAEHHQLTAERPPFCRGNRTRGRGDRDGGVARREASLQADGL
jgi:hypothetical protein